MLKNDTLTVVVSPSAGRLIHLSFIHQPNLLRTEEESAGRLPDDTTTDFINHGGDWFWPTSQTNWTAFSDADWPPSLLIEGRPWEGRAWEGADGTRVVEMTQTYGDPLNLRVTRTFTLPPSGAWLTIDQKAVSDGGSLPITLWNITQIGDARRAFLPLDSAQPDGGVSPMMFGDPDPAAMIECERLLIYTPEVSVVRKLGGKSRASWIAALKGSTLIIEYMTEPNPHAPHPDGDVTVEMFSGTDPKYIEIETLGEERILGKGDELRNRITIGLLKHPRASSPCDWETTIQEFLDLQ